MRLDEEYCLSEYVDLGRLGDNEKVHIVRNQVNGVIGVRKYVAYAIRSDDGSLDTGHLCTGQIACPHAERPESGQHIVAGSCHTHSA